MQRWTHTQQLGRMVHGLNTLSPVNWGLARQLMGASLVAQRLKHLPPMRETRVQSLGREDPLEKEMVTHSSILAWRITWTEKPGRLQSTGSQRVGHNWATSLSLFTLTFVSYGFMNITCKNFQSAIYINFEKSWRQRYGWFFFDSVFTFSKSLR